jgi:hypothetical protein
VDHRGRPSSRGNRSPRGCRSPAFRRMPASDVPAPRLCRRTVAAWRDLRIAPEGS